MPRSDEELIAEFVRARDEAVFHELYRRHTPLLFALGLRLTRGQRPDAEELVQDTWIRAIENLRRFEGRSSLRTWLCGILVNCYREWRRRRSKTPVSTDDPRHARWPEASTDAFYGESVDIERALAGLPDGYREVVILHDVNGHTHREIATLLEIEEGTSKSQLARGRARLREALAPAAPPSNYERGTT